MELLSTYPKGARGKLSETYRDALVRYGADPSRVPSEAEVVCAAGTSLFCVVPAGTGFAVRRDAESRSALYVPPECFVSETPSIPLLAPTRARMMNQHPEEWKHLGGRWPLSISLHHMGAVMPHEIREKFGATQSAFYNALARYRRDIWVKAGCLDVRSPQF